MKTNTNTMEKRIDDFKKDILAEYQETTRKFQEEVKERQFMKGVQSLQDTLPEIENIPITKANADQVVRIFKLLERFKGNPDQWSSGWDSRVIEQAGRDLGFDEKVSYSIYYMARYAEAHERLVSKKTKLYQIITGVSL